MADKLINVQEHVFENNSVKGTINEVFIEKKENTSKLGRVKENTSKTNHVKEKKSIVDVLKFVSPGTAIRTALDDILHAGLGALIVFEKEGLSSIIDGGFRINCRFSPQKLVELTKMDGAVIISEDLKKILYANALLNPNVKITTKETGTRHKAAERTSKQFQTIAIAVSERRNKITLYYGEENFYIEETSEILRRAAETIQILEKQKDIFDELLSHLNVLEITNLTTMSDVCSVLQTIEIIRRISESVKRYLIELGKEGLIISMRLKELTKNLIKNRESILNDYFGSASLKKDEMLQNMNFDFLLENLNVLRILFDEIHDNSISSRGMRILSKTNLLEKDIKIILDNFKTLDEIFNLNRESLRHLFNNNDFIDSFLTEIKNLKEKILMGKKI